MLEGTAGRRCKTDRRQTCSLPAVGFRRVSRHPANQHGQGL